MKQFLFLMLTISMFTACKDKAATITETATEATEAIKEEVTKAIKGTPLNVNTVTSLVNWTGVKPTGQHTGTIKLSKGMVFTDNGKVTGAKIMIDMNSIDCTDLSGEYKADLEAHLKGTKAGEEDHFFNVASHPIAMIEISKVIEVKNSETATHRAMGNLTIKGISKPVGIPCNITVDDNGVHVVTKGFEIDRTQWNVNYGSKTIFSDLKDKFINDKIQIDLDITASK